VADAGAILVIDDDAGIREALADYLRSEGFRVDLAADGAEGLERLRAARPDVILVDQFMPGMDGGKFLERLRADPVQRALPVVLMSGARAAGAAASAADLVLLKPFELEELLAALRRFRPPPGA
jgi:CheY-like chemotaxis protein